MTDITLAPARPEHGEALNALILRSKAHWGYDAEMMAVMARVLTLDPDAQAYHVEQASFESELASRPAETP